ncbi:MAG: 4-hydroxy-tetrahydrodipicolinate synthase, partial [Clostridia bacterium]|nr:4-hydroxy-tetrahydrodipicolinate synthase [Clostridia bacterium]
ASTLTLEEKVDICKFAVEYVNHRVPVIIGSGGNNTVDVIEKSQMFERLGADALLIVTPYYNKATQNGLIEHYTKIANHVSLPIILYNVPTRTAVNLAPETVLKLSKIKNIVGVKEASSDLNQIHELFRILPKDFAVYSGDDANIYTLLALGGSGVISVVSNILPEKTAMLCDDFFKGGIQNAKEAQLEMLPLIKCLFSEVNPIPVKYAAKLLGFGNGETRLPLTIFSEEKRPLLIEEMKKFNLINQI